MDFFHSNRIAKLREIARSWEGTPFRKNSEAQGQGGGVDCVRLVACILEEVGAIETIDRTLFPRYNIDHGQHNRESVIERVLIRVGMLREGSSGPVGGRDKVIRNINRIKAGDIICANFGQCVHHLAIYLGDGDVVSAYPPKGTLFFRVCDRLPSNPRKTLRDVFAYAIRIQERGMG